MDVSSPLDTILHWCLVRRNVDRLLATARESIAHRRNPDEPRVESAVREIFGDSVVDSMWATAWPGTEILEGGAGKVYVVQFDRTIAARMTAVENRLSGWNQWHEPPLPADLCLYRDGDAAPTLVSMTHDPGEGWREAWLFDSDASGASFAEETDIALPARLIPPPPAFVTRTATTAAPRSKSRRVPTQRGPT